MKRRCQCGFGAVMVSEVADQVDESLNNAHWAREGLEELGREDLAQRLDDVVAILREIDRELTQVRGGAQ